MSMAEASTPCFFKIKGTFKRLQFLKLIISYLKIKGKPS